MPEGVENKWKIYVRAKDESDTVWGTHIFVDPKGIYRESEHDPLFSEDPVLGLAFLTYVGICFCKIGENYELKNELPPDEIQSKVKPYCREYFEKGRELTESEMEKFEKKLEDYMKEERIETF